MNNNNQHPILTAPQREQERWLRDHGYKFKYGCIKYGSVNMFINSSRYRKIVIENELAAEAIREKRKSKVPKFTEYVKPDGFASALGMVADIATVNMALNKKIARLKKRKAVKR